MSTLPNRGPSPHSEPRKGRENLALRTEVRWSMRSARCATSRYALVPRLDTNRTRAGQDEGGWRRHAENGNPTQSTEAVPKHLAAHSSVYAPARFFGLVLFDFVQCPFLRMTRRAASVRSFPHSEPRKGRENLALRTEVRWSMRSARCATSRYALVPRLDTNRTRAGQDEGGWRRHAENGNPTQSTEAVPKHLAAHSSVYAPARFFGLVLFDFVQCPFLRMTRGLLPCILRDPSPSTTLRVRMSAGQNERAGQDEGGLRLFHESRILRLPTAKRKYEQKMQIR